jgi:hypothetical protein
MWVVLIQRVDRILKEVTLPRHLSPARVRGNPTPRTVQFQEKGLINVEITDMGVIDDVAELPPVPSQIW